MNQNNNRVTQAIAVDEALAFAERAENAAEVLDRLKGNPTAPNRAALIGKANRELGLSLKLAEVHATLAIADELRSLRSGTSDQLRVGMLDARRCS